MLKLFGVQRTTKKLVYIGFSLFELLNKETGQLHGGAFRLTVHQGLPTPPKGGLLNLRESDAEKMEKMPGCSILIRILRPDSDSQPRPFHKDGHYDNRGAQPSQLERKLFQHYFEIHSYDESLLKVGGRIKDEDEKEKNTSLDVWIAKTLEDTRKAPFLNTRYFNYNNPRTGVKIKVASASGLPFSFEDMFCQCTVEIIGSKKTEKQITQKPVMNSFQHHPQWSDRPFHFHPGTTDKSVAILIKIYGILCNNLKIDKSYKLSFTKEPHISAEKPLAWTICPLFDDDSVEAGQHVLPLFSGSPPDPFIQLMKTRGASPVLIKFGLTKSIIKPFKTGSVLNVNVHDGLYEEDELFEEMKKKDDRLIEAAGIQQKYLNIVEEGSTLIQLMSTAFKEAKLGAPTKIQLKKSFDSLTLIMNEKFKKVK